MQNQISVSNLSLSDLQEWGTKNVERGEWSQTERNRLVGALEALMTVLGGDEPSDLGSVLENLDSIMHRWVTGGNQNPETGRTYRGRAKRLIETFVYYKQNAKMPERKAKSTAKAKAKTKAKTVDECTTEALRSFPLEGDGRDIQYTFPRDARTTELRRFYYHLCTLAVDFDPGDFQSM